LTKRRGWRREVFERDKGRCAFCTLDTVAAGVRWEADHVIPLALGGEDTLENHRTLCEGCHKAATKRLARFRKHNRRLRIPHPPEDFR
jgi:5-methylcytosine-specific restriction endonuclease McrA